MKKFRTFQLVEEKYKEWLHRMIWNIKIIWKNRKFVYLIRFIVVVLFVIYFSGVGFEESYLAKGNFKLQEGIAKEIIRFHVIANSDTDADQAVKLKVKDAVVTALRPKMSQVEDIEEARDVVNKNQEMIQLVARNTLLENGFDYDVSVSLKDETFPIKVYGDITLPAGIYEALCVRIGKAEGHNWWCIVFPSLCYVDETYSYVPDDSKDELHHVLSDEEYESITENRNDTGKEKGIRVKPKFKIWEYLKKYF